MEPEIIGALIGACATIFAAWKFSGKVDDTVTEVETVETEETIGSEPKPHGKGDTLPDPTRPRTTLPTWGGRANFEFTGSLKKGVTLFYGKRGKTTEVPAEMLLELLAKLSGMTLPAGATHDAEAIPGTLEAAIREVRGDKTSLTTYLASIIVHEGLGERAGPNQNHIFIYPANQLGEAA